MSQNLAKQLTSGTQWILNLAGTLLLMMALMISTGALGIKFLIPTDPVFHWPTGWVLGVFSGLYGLSALICLFAQSIQLRAVILFWLATNMAVYFLAGGKSQIDGWLSPLENAFALPAGGGRWSTIAVWFYILLASGLVCLWPGLCRWLGIAEYVKMFCPACGGHISFSISNLGQKVSCPHCQTSVILRKPEEDLKMSCFFCHKHIAFPAHALGQKIQCPHCHMDITLKEPA
jgi:DNA-directed RNA polymerase subunit RPC12/RpoP